MTDMNDLRARHRALVFACRTIRDRFGEDAVDLVAEQHAKNVRAAFRKEAAETGRNDMAALAERMGTPSDTHTYDPIRGDADVLEFRITRCAHAEIFAEMNATDIGRKFMCAGDDAMIEGFNPDISLERPALLMTGGDHCHFIYRMRK